MSVRDLLTSYNRQALQEGRHARLLLRLSLLAAVDPNSPALARAEELLGHAFSIGSATFHAVLQRLSDQRLLAEVRVTHDGVLVAWPPGAREVLAHPRAEDRLGSDGPALEPASPRPQPQPQPQP